MPTFQHVLFPVDFSTQNRSIAPYVACMARRYHARVAMLSVLEIPAWAYPGFEYAPATDLAAMMEQRKECLDSFLKDELRDLPISRVVLQGDPASQIAEYAEQEKIDLIMMPTHGYGPFRRFLLGSVTAKLLHDAKCAIWTSAHAPESLPPPAGYRKVLCALDLSAKSLPLLKWAADFTRDHGAALKLVHAIPAASVPGGLEPEGGRFRTFLCDWAREEFAKLQKEAGTTFETVVEGGDVAHVISQAAKANRADLVVIGRGVMQDLLGRLRTNVYSIIRESPCPVISI
jgi:nucleotide-binding universal stress UspA family protein